MLDNIRQWLRTSIDTLIWVLTLLAIIIAIVLLWRSGVVLYPNGRPLRLDQLDELGEFLAGIAAPVGVAWVARTFYLQRQQLSQSIQAIRDQMAQSRDQYERDHRPSFNAQINSSGRTSGVRGSFATFDVMITNHGAPSAPTTFLLRCYRPGQSWIENARNRAPVIAFAQSVSNQYTAPIWAAEAGTLQVFEVCGVASGGRRTFQRFAAIKGNDAGGYVELPEVDDLEYNTLMASVSGSS